MITEEQKYELLYDKIMNDLSDTEQRIRDTIEKSGVEVNTTDLWNIFDTLIVLISLIPIPNNSSFLLLRLLRVFRVLRIISVVPELKKIIEALLSSVKRVFYVGLLLFIILYIYATIGSILFSTNIPERWGDVGVAMITLFQVLTLSSWEQVMLPLQDVYWWAWIYFFSFIIICGITMLNLLIAILVDVVINQKKL